MTRECCRTQDRLLELQQEPDPTHPEEPVLAPLRKHLQGCPLCQAEAAELLAFLRLDKEAQELLPSEAEFAALDIGSEEREEAFLQYVRENGPWHAAHAAREREKALGAKPDGRADAQRVFEAVRRVFTFPPILLPRATALAAADAHEPAEDLPEQLLQVSDAGDTALVELLLNRSGSQLFLTIHEPGPQQGSAEVTLTLESGQTASHTVTLTEGVGVWDLPPALTLEGTCSVQARFDPPADEKA
jgi:hypothetical protein